MLNELFFYEKNGFNITDYYYHEGTEVYQVMATDASLMAQDYEKLVADNSPEKVEQLKVMALEKMAICEFILYRNQKAGVILTAIIIK